MKMSDYEKYLFRGKEKDSGKWIYGDLRHISDGHGGYILCIVDNTNGRNNDVTGIEVSPNTVGQYTGMTDKNSTKIFEGDIIESVSRLVNSVGTPTGGTDISRYIIEWGEHKWVKKIFFCNRGDYWKKNNVLPKDLYPYTTSRYCEVIGNIYDNSELLEDGEEDD
jgi:uncharacterized phage protein (TIGR01671 family)